jgi:hypothetical protein
MAVFKATIDQIHRSPHMSLLRRGGVIWQEGDEAGESFGDCYRPQHEGIVRRAIRLDHQATREVQCAKCVEKYGPCNQQGTCFWSVKRRAVENLPLQGG